MTRVTVLGGGQLGRMLGLAGVPLGVTCAFLDPAAGAPTSAVGPVVVGELDDCACADAAAVGAAVVTYEWEGVPATTARHLAENVPVLPPPRALETAQDRLFEKQMFVALGIETAAFRPIETRAEMRAAVADLGLPAVVKTRRGGYDGKGQTLIRREADIDDAFGALRGVPLIVEAFVPFARELSVLAVRGGDGAFACWPLVENQHAGGILRISRAPVPRLDDALQARAAVFIQQLFEHLDYVGVGCVELFELDGTLLANEFAPRVHNSGHWTIEGADTSQFENHLRAILGLPLGSCAPRGVSAMVNCIGAMPDREAVLRIPGAHLHDYAKAPRPGRKLGHVTITAPDEATLEARLAPLLALVDNPKPEPA